MNEHVHYGCGLQAPPTWRNFDASPTLRLQKVPLLRRYLLSGKYPIFPRNVEYGHIVKGLPVSANSCRAIYCSHVLEHLALDEFRIALKNTYSYLESKGVFRLVVPDLEQLARNYLDSKDVNASYLFMENSGLGKKTRHSGPEGFLRDFFGNSSHLWMWDFRSLSTELQQVGFKEIRSARFGDSKDSRFHDVEDEDRWTSSFCIECVK